MMGAGKELVERLPEDKRPISHSNVRCNGQAPPLDLDEKLAPALGALAHASLEADQLLLAFRRGADQHQDAFGLILIRDWRQMPSAQT